MELVRGRKARSAWLVLGAATGCANLFGYEYPEENCIINSDCPGQYVCILGACAQQCRDAIRDCQPGATCSADHLCVMTSPSLDASSVNVVPLDATGPGDAGDSAPLPDTSDGGGAGDAACEVTTGATSCGSCADACPSHVCTDDGTCLYPVLQFPEGFPYPEPAAHWWTVPFSPNKSDGTEGMFTGELIHLPRGILVGLGVISDYAGVNGYVGLYTNDDVQPQNRLAATAEFATTGGPPDKANPLLTQVDVAPILIEEGDYFILGLWQSTIFVASAFTADQCDAGHCLPSYGTPIPFGPPPSVAVPNARNGDVAPPMGLFAEVAPLPP